MMEIGVNLLNGISYGMILFIIASGLSLIFGVMGILNLAHGALYVLGAYIGLTLAKQGTNFLLAALAAGAVVGLAIFRTSV
jgi:branched-chain amino acid transport system permease protein